jgi:CarD family transcriptional regulator
VRGGIPRLPPPLAVGAHVVHPTHGVGEITGVETREISGLRFDFFVVRLLGSGVHVRVAKTAVDQVGLRAVTAVRARALLAVLRARTAESPPPPRFLEFVRRRSNST